MPIWGSVGLPQVRVLQGKSLKAGLCVHFILWVSLIARNERQGIAFLKKSHMTRSPQYPGLASAF